MFIDIYNVEYWRGGNFETHICNCFQTGAAYYLLEQMVKWTWPYYSTSLVKRLIKVLSLKDLCRKQEHVFHGSERLGRERQSLVE